MSKLSPGESRLLFHGSGYDSLYRFAEGEEFTVRQADIVERNVFGYDVIFVVPRHDVPFEQIGLYGVFIAMITNRPVAFPIEPGLIIIDAMTPHLDSLWITPDQELEVIEQLRQIDGTDCLSEQDKLIMGMRAKSLAPN